MAVRARRPRTGRGSVASVERVTVGGRDVELTRKGISHAYLRVDDVSGPIRVSAPVGMPLSSIEAFVEGNAAWIDRRLAQLASGAPASPRRGHVAADATVLLWGVRRPLEEVAPDAAARLLGACGPCSVAVPPLRNRVRAAWEACTPEVRRAVGPVVVGALRLQLAERAEPLVDVWETRMGVDVAELRYRDMQTRWGTCNTGARRVWLAVSLAHFPPTCLELIVVHELCHLLEHGHGPRFKALMGHYLPDWREREALLRRFAQAR